MKDGYHPYFKHHHLAYDVEQGRADFEEAISDIFRRNGITLELTAAGTVERLAPDVLREALASAAFATGDKLLDATLQDGHRKNFLARTKATGATRSKSYGMRSSA